MAVRRVIGKEFNRIDRGRTCVQTPFVAFFHSTTWESDMCLFSVSELVVDQRRVILRWIFATKEENFWTSVGIIHPIEIKEFRQCRLGGRCCRKGARGGRDDADNKCNCCTTRFCKNEEFKMK